MRIGMILDNSFPPDSRVENEATSLIRDGHEVFLFCLNRGGEASEEVINGINIRRYPTNILEYKLSALAYTVPWYHFLMASKIDSFVRNNNPEALHVHDLTIARAAFKIAGKHSLPIVLDLHENRPVIMKEYTHLKKWPGKFLISPQKWSRYEAKFAREANRVIVVTDEAADDLAQTHQIPRNKITVVPNTVDSSIYMKYPIYPGKMLPEEGLFRVLYMGDTGLRRGTDTAIEAISKLKDKIPGIRLTLVGANTEDNVLRSMVERLNLQDHVIFEGWQDVSLFPSYVSGADVCISPLKRNRHHDTTFANKIFQYMAGGKPLVVSDCPPQVRVILESKCGLIFKADDPNELALRLKYLHDHPDIAAEMGSNGKRAVEKRWNWSETSKQLLSMYRILADDLPV